MEIKTIVATLKTAADLVSGFNKLKSETELLQAKSELLQLIYQARIDIMELQAEQTALLSRCADLENQLLEQENFAHEKQHYRLHRFESGGLVYRFQPPPDSNIPEHDVCAHCYQKNIKSILQFSGYDGAHPKYSCPNCQNSILGKAASLGVGILSTRKRITDGYDW